MKRVTPMKAIRLKCLDCSGNSYKEVELCPIHNCALYPFRFGKRPETVQPGKKEADYTQVR